jgi:PAS domain S-box-containing protein
MNNGPCGSSAILDHSPIGHFILDRELKVRYWNRCLESWTGLSREAVVGHGLRDFFPHLMEPKYLSRIETILQGGPPTTFSSQLHKYFIPSPLPGGRLRVQHTVVTSLAMEEPDTFLALFSIQDVTSLTDTINLHTEALHRLTVEAEERQKEVHRRMEVEESLHEMDRMKNDFIASATHELNTPLATIQGYAELLQEGAGHFDDARKGEFVNEIIVSAKGLGQIINDLFDVARFERGRGIHLNKRQVDPNDLVRRVARHFEAQRVTHRFSLELSVDLGREIECDPIRIHQVLENVVSNAVKYSPPGTVITISTEWDVSGVILSIADQGIGMNVKQVARVFDKFYRGDVSDTAVRGLGLGMNIVKQIVDQHGGSITVASKPEHGTNVTIFLPEQFG